MPRLFQVKWKGTFRAMRVKNFKLKEIKRERWAVLEKRFIAYRKTLYVLY
jgi:hypothetical protein